MIYEEYLGTNVWGGPPHFGIQAIISRELPLSGDFLSPNWLHFCPSSSETIRRPRCMRGLKIGTSRTTPLPTDLKLEMIAARGRGTIGIGYCD